MALPPQLIIVAAAEPIGDQQIPETTIQITTKLRVSELNAPLHGSVHGTQAQMIADALEKSLPGGTWDRLVAEMVRRHASLLVIRRPE